VIATAATWQLRWLLDTNIITEPARPRPDPQVMSLLLAHADEVALPVTVLQELHFGWLRMPEGRQKQHIGTYLHALLAQVPVLGLDAAGARLQADLRWRAQLAGRPMTYPDSEIAAIAMAHGLTLVSRNTRDFADRPGLQLANWFSD
jgi:tRNA(fMet)-specific endonuclease VapC